MKYLTEKAVRVGDVQLTKQKSKFLKAHTSSGHKRAIEELLGDSWTFVPIYGHLYRIHISAYFTLHHYFICF